MKKHVIITSSDVKVGDFLVNHWFKSLKENVNLKNIDVVVINYGLLDRQIKILESEGVIIVPGMKNHHIVNKRFFDAREFLKKNKYDQVLFIDSGDVIFQGDINGVLNKDKQTFRVVPLGMKILFFEWFLTYYGNFEGQIKKRIWRVVKDKPVLNAGVIFAPQKKFIGLVEEMRKTVKNKSSFGPDQVVLNYYLYKNGFKVIDDKYNFMIVFAKDGFYVKKGIFYKESGEKVVIVHNAGQMDFFRPIESFGYGPNYNKLKPHIYNIKRSYYKVLSDYKKIFKP